LTHGVLLYIDPGSGSYLVQMIIAGILGALFYFKSLWFRVRSFFTRKKKQAAAENDNENS